MGKLDFSSKEKKRVAQPPQLKKVEPSVSDEIKDRLEAQKQPTFNTPIQAVENKFLYKVKQGDTMGALAKEFYGDEAHWIRIKRANDGIKGVGDSPNEVLGMVELVIPRS